MLFYIIDFFIFQLTHCYSQLIQYKNKFELKFSANNLLHLNQLIYVVGKLISVLGNVLYLDIDYKYLL